MNISELNSRCPIPKRRKFYGTTPLPERDKGRTPQCKHLHIHDWNELIEVLEV